MSYELCDNEKNVLVFRAGVELCVDTMLLICLSEIQILFALSGRFDVEAMSFRIFRI